MIVRELKAFGENKRTKGAGIEGPSACALQGGWQVNVGQLKRYVFEAVKARVDFLILVRAKAHDIVPESERAPFPREILRLKGVGRKDGQGKKEKQGGDQTVFMAAFFLRRGSFYFLIIIAACLARLQGDFITI